MCIGSVRHKALRGLGPTWREYLPPTFSTTMKVPPYQIRSRSRRGLSWGQGQAHRGGFEPLKVGLQRALLHQECSVDATPDSHLLERQRQRLYEVVRWGTPWLCLCCHQVGMFRCVNFQQVVLRGRFYLSYLGTHLKDKALMKKWFYSKGYTNSFIITAKKYLGLLFAANLKGLHNEIF